MRTKELPAEALMFAVLDTPVGRGPEVRRELMYQLEAVVPGTIEDVHAVFERLGDGRVLACACGRAELEALRGRFERVAPAALPEWVEIEDGEAVRGRLNLLCGDLRPVSHERRARVTAKVVCVAAVVLLLLVYIGTEQRTQQIEMQIEHIEGQMLALYDAVLPAVDRSSQPAAVRFAALMNRTIATRSGGNFADDPRLVEDAAAVLAVWPESAHARVQNIVVGQDAIRMELSVPSNENAGELLSRLRGLDGWELVSHQITPRGAGVDVSIRMNQVASASASRGAS